MELYPREELHIKIMRTICEVINGNNKPLVLKGGTALMLCYDIDRFSEDLDFDQECDLKTHLNIESMCKEAVKKLSRQGIDVQLQTFADLKKTDTTHRCRALFRLPDEALPVNLKIEISARNTPAPSTVQEVQGIKVYSIDEIARLKLLAATEDTSKPYRTAARDLHDLVFIASEYEDELSEETIESLEAFFTEPEALMERYADAYETDMILRGRLFGDLDVIEQWNNNRGEDKNLGLFQS